MRELFRRQPKFKPAEGADGADLPEDLFFKCSHCKQLNYGKEFQESLKVCQHCSFHTRLTAPERIAMLLDPDSFQEWDPGLCADDPLEFVAGPPGKEESYRAKIENYRRKSGLPEMVVTGAGQIKEQPLAIVVSDFAFLGASMGSVYGEKMARAAERATEQGLPLLTISASGGARMYEGLFSLMQMAKTTGALRRLSAARLPHLSLLTDPCYGGVTASYATVADIVLAEPGARIGFAGQRVIEQTIRQKLPEGFQTAEFMLEHGLLDLVVPRRELRDTIGTLLRLLTQQETPALPDIVTTIVAPVEEPVTTGGRDEHD